MLEPWMLQTTVPTAAVVALWVRIEFISKTVEATSKDVKRINGTVREHSVTLRDQDREINRLRDQI